MTQYFFDLTRTALHLKRYARFTGIERTVVMLIEKAAAQIGAEHVHICIYDKALRTYRTFPFTALAPDELTDPSVLRARLDYGLWMAGLHPVLKKYRNEPLKLFFHNAKFQVASLIGYERVFRRNNLTGQDWRDHSQRHKKKSALLQFLPLADVARPGDKLVLLDGAYLLPTAAGAFRAAHAMGLSTFTMVYDLVPIVVSKVASGLGPLTFYDSLLDSESYTDSYLTDSQSAKDDLHEFLTVHGIDRPIQVIRLAQAALPSKAEADSGPLAAKVDRETYSEVLDSSVIEDRIRRLASYPYVLCVGTLEGRKNNWRLATVWDRLRRVEGVRLPKLVFAGRSGWLNDDFNRLMQATGQLGGWVEIVEGPSDRELEYLYKNCEFVAMPSLYEGWGLPVGEALSYGKTAVVSNTSSLPEVGMDLVEYCDPTSIDSIAEACLRLIADPDHRLALEKKISETKLRSWDDVARDLVAAVLGE